MDIVIKNLKEEYLALITELSKTLDFEISEPIDNSPYHPEFTAKIKQGDEDIEAGHTTKITLDDIWEKEEKESIEKGLADAEAGKINPHAKAKKLYEKWL